MDTTSIINRRNKRCARGLDGGHVGRLILRLSEEEQRQRKVEAQIAKFRECISKRTRGSLPNGKVRGKTKEA